MRVLIVEESAITRESIRRVFKNYTTATTLDFLEAETGEMAWQLIRAANGNIDVITMSGYFVRPGTNYATGVEVVALLREAGYKIPIIAIGEPDVEVAHSFGRVGADAFWDKTPAGGVNNRLVVSTLKKLDLQP